MSYLGITLYELAGSRYADLLREASEQRKYQAAAGIGCKSSRPLRIFDAIAAFVDHQRVTATRSLRDLWPSHA